MTNNTNTQNATAQDDEVIERAQNMLKNIYMRHVSWRAVAVERGVNVRYVWELATRGTVPRNPDVRQAVFLPRVMPSERRRKVKREVVKIGAPGWEAVYFKKVKVKR